jgi:hypothetical protein
LTVRQSALSPSHVRQKWTLHLNGAMSRRLVFVQVLLHESSWNEIVGGERGEPDRAVFVNMGRHELKGVTRTVYIIQVWTRLLFSNHRHHFSATHIH